MTSYAAFLGQVTIDSSNNAIALKEGAGAYVAKTITSGDYFTRDDGVNAVDLLREIEDALNTGSLNTYTASMVASVNPAAKSAVITITRATGVDTFSLGFAQGATTFSPLLIGFPATDTANDAAAKASTLSPTSIWVSPDVPSFFEPEDEYDVSVTRARAGRVRTLRRGGPLDSRRVRFDLLDSRRVLDWDNIADPAATFARFLQRVGDGKRFEFHTTALSSGTTLGALSASTLLGTAWHFDEATAMRFAPERAEPGLAFYGFDLGLWGYVS